METEEWKTIERFPGYEFSSLGRIRSYLNVGRYKPENKFLSTCRYLKQHEDKKSGYFSLKISVNGINKTIRVAPLILEAFVGPKPSPKLEACHNDDVKSNNCISNLRWDTAKNNSADKIKHGTTNKGSKHPNAKLTEASVVILKEILQKVNLSSPVIANAFDVSPRCVRDIKNGLTWSHVNFPSTLTY